ncbi:FixH family protein [Bacillus sp. AK128]
MKKFLLVLVLLVSMMLSACSLNEGVADLYKKENPLKAEVFIPENFSAGQQEAIEVVLIQNEGKVTNPDYVHLEIWKQDRSVHYPMEEASKIGEGTYRVTKDFDQDGLYFVKVHASSAGSIIFPQKQFIVGELSKSELEFLQKGLKVESDVSESHH